MRVGIPIVPITINAEFQATQPTPKRCYDFGKAVAQAINAWDSTSRIAVVAVGGLSHRLIDEEFDRSVLEAMRSKDVAALCSMPVERLSSGTGEVRCWIAAAATLDHLTMTIVNYHPCYRSVGGTGCGMAFATWT